MGASCFDCHYYKQWHEPSGEPLVDCKAIDTAPQELSLKIEEYFRGNSSGNCPLFDDEDSNRDSRI